MRFALQLGLLVTCLASTSALPTGRSWGAELDGPEGVSTRDARLQAIRGIPLHKLQPQVSGEVREVLENPSYFRRMPSQQITCDPQMFTFLVRRPEVMVNIWEVMGITKVKARRTSPFTFLADDGVGTSCQCDLVYSDNDLHIYLGNGTYDGTMAPRKVTGRCVCLLRTENQTISPESPNIAGTMDVFLKVDNFGADLLTRTIGPFVGKTADYNFVETSKFIGQISQICQTNPAAAQALVMRLDRVDDATRREFAEIVARLAMYQGPVERLETLSAQQRELWNDEQTTAGSPPASLRNNPVAQTVPPVQRSMSSNSYRPSGYLPSGYQPSSSAASPRGEPVIVETSAAQFAPPAAIVPHKANIYMRR